MGLTGLIFVVITGGWLAFLVPWLLSHRDQTVPVADEDVIDRFAESMQLIRRGVDPFADQNDPELQISTPLQRAAIRRECARVNKTAAARRRVGLVGHLLLVVAGVVLVFVAPMPWWVGLVPVGLLVCFLALSRVSVLTVRHMVAAKLAVANCGWDVEDTVVVTPLELSDEHNEDTERQIELSVPIAQLGSLWEPIPVTPPTYVSKPMVPRSVRTIDLSAPVPPASVPKLPVIAEAPEDADDPEAPGGEAEPTNRVA